MLYSSGIDIKNAKQAKKEISKELLLVVCHPTRRQDQCMSEDEKTNKQKKEIESF